MNTWYQEVRVSSWEQADHIRKHFHRLCVYRGEQSADWSLASTFERAIREWRAPDARGIYDAEASVLRQLKTLAPNYDVRLPTTDRPVEWLALLQHHGGATRLLDVTSSFYVAAFFAFELPSKSPHAIWCINRVRLIHGAWKLCNPGSDIEGNFGADEIGSDWEDVFVNEIVDGAFGRGVSPDVVVPVTTDFRSDRMQAQQGSFLMSSSVDAQFATVMASLVGELMQSHAGFEPIDYSTDAHAWRQCWAQIKRAPVVKLILSPDVRLEAMRELEEMNVTSTSLFPGFDGFARSLKQELREGLMSKEEMTRISRTMWIGIEDARVPPRDRP